MKEDLSRGYFDAGDHLKFTLPMAFSMTLLSWSLLQARIAQNFAERVFASKILHSIRNFQFCLAEMQPQN